MVIFGSTGRPLIGHTLFTSATAGWAAGSAAPAGSTMRVGHAADRAAASATERQMKRFMAIQAMVQVRAEAFIGRGGQRCICNTSSNQVSSFENCFAPAG